MVLEPTTFDPFASFGDSAKTKLVVLGSLSDLPEAVLSRVRSLNITEHVSSASLLRREISRPSSRSPKGHEDATAALMRRWFWSRKPDAGFVLSDYPATLLQAILLDDWLEARNEALDAVLAVEKTPAAVVEHYRNHGLLFEFMGHAPTVAA